MATTTFEYGYRDGANYGKSASWTVSGTFSPADAACLLSTFDDGFFIPLAVGIPMLSPGGDEASEDDHAWHTLDSLKVGDAPIDEDRTTEDLLIAFLSANWEKAMAQHALGRPLETT